MLAVPAAPPAAAESGNHGAISDLVAMFTTTTVRSCESSRQINDFCQASAVGHGLA